MRMEPIRTLTRDEKEIAMSSQKELQERISELVRTADARLEARSRARHDLMERIGGKKERFGELADHLIVDVVCPRLEVLTRSFGHAGPIVAMAGGHGMAVAFEHTEEFPAHARVEVGIGHDPDCESAWCTFAPTIIPILMDYERERSLDVSVESPDREGLGAFLDERIERFVASYLSVREPESPYQKDFLVTDPVCGMTFRRVDALAVVDYEGRRVFFCADICRKHFEAAPDRHGRSGAVANPR